ANYPAFLWLFLSTTLKYNDDATRESHEPCPANSVYGRLGFCHWAFRCCRCCDERKPCGSPRPFAAESRCECGANRWGDGIALGCIPRRHGGSASLDQRRSQGRCSKPRRHYTPVYGFSLWKCGIDQRACERWSRRETERSSRRNNAHAGRAKRQRGIDQTAASGRGRRQCARTRSWHDSLDVGGRAEASGGR